MLGSLPSAPGAARIGFEHRERNRSARMPALIVIALRLVLPLTILLARRWFPRFVPRTVRQSVLASFILLIPKELQEYVLHYAQLHPWQWLRETFIKPLIGG